MRKARPPASKRERKPAPLDAAAARGRALKLLSGREHSAAELQAKLSRRGADAAVARDAVRAMADAGWQSDARYAEMLVRNRIGQGYGPLRIRMELGAAGVPDADQHAAIEAAACDWAALCAELAARRFKSAGACTADWQKQYRFLAARGFTSAQIRAALKAIARPAADDWEPVED